MKTRHSVLPRHSGDIQLQDISQLRLTNLNDLDPLRRKNVLRLCNREENINHVSQDFFCWLYINPMSTFAISWNLLFIAFFYFIEMQISLQLAFGSTFFLVQLGLTSYQILYSFFVIFLSTDIFLSFFKGYYVFGRGAVIDDSLKIRMNYLKGQFLIDITNLILYIIPLFKVDYLVYFTQIIPAILLWKKKLLYQHQIENFLQYNRRIRAFFSLGILFFDVLMIGNYGGCIFVGLDIFLWNEQFFGSNTSFYWLSSCTLYPINLIGGAWYIQYIYGLMFSTGTLSTMAPGPFARNPVEFYAIFVMIFFMILATYVGQVIVEILYKFTVKRIFHEENIMSFDKYMQLKAVDRTIRSRIYNFFELIWEFQVKLETKQQENMIQKLPKHLKEQLLVEISFSKNIFFLRHLSHEFQLQKLIALKLTRQTIDSNTVIFRSAKICPHESPNYLFFIKEGMAKFYLTHTKEDIFQDNEIITNSLSQKILSLTNVDRVLGIYEFVTRQRYILSCKSIDLCLLQKLQLRELQEILRENEALEEWRQLQSEVLFGRKLHKINKCCVICNEMHLESECPSLNCKALESSSKSYKKKKTQRLLYRRKQLKSIKILNGNLSEKIIQGQYIPFKKMLGNINVQEKIMLKNLQFSVIQPQKVFYYTKYFPEFNI